MRVDRSGTAVYVVDVDGGNLRSIDLLTGAIASIGSGLDGPIGPGALFGAVARLEHRGEDFFGGRAADLDRLNQ